MWTSVPAHIDPYPSKARLLLETSGGINELCLQWVPYIPGTTAQDVPLLGGRNLPQGKQEGLIVCPYQDSGGGSQHSPRSPGGPQVRPDIFSCTTYLIPL